MVGRFFAADSSLRKPALVPYFKGGLKGRLLNIQEGVARNVSGLYDAVRSAVVSPFVRLKRATSVSSGVSAESVSAGVDGGGEEVPEQQQQQQQRPQQEEPARDRLPLSPAERLRLLNPKTGRVDWCLQEGLLENAYLSALLVHLTYWSDYDIAMFILRQCYS
ncbi:MAG: DDHD domain-containing protein [Olpidium bornovanus]|uniref:DDHD domain-containing protein n=1 Tax=Olpidium bornovanus TaxID=278681 RepID=A0A8H7ZS74_9FUNG|nr:MAG: DDHD domain-containing protein [Olpidium bornovanus]